MKIDILNINGEKTKTIELPEQFNELYRVDLMQRAVVAYQSSLRQPYGPSKEAGKRAVISNSKRRRAFRGVYGYGISRMPKKALSKKGSRINWVGAFAPGTVSGRRAHPPKPEKGLVKKINKKEKFKAIRSAISAAEKRVVESSFENLVKTKDIKRVLQKLLNYQERKNKKGPLIVISKNCSLRTSLPGVDVCQLDKLNIQMLTKGFLPRESLWSEQAIEELKNDKLYL